MVKKKESKKKPSKDYLMILLAVVGLAGWTAASVIVSQLIVGYPMLWFLGPETFSRPIPTAIYSALSYIVAMVLIIVFPALIYRKWRKGSSNKEEGRETSRPSIRETLGLVGLPTWADIGLAILGFIVYLCISSCLVYLFSKFPWFNVNEAQDVGFDSYATGVDRAVAFLALVVIAPIAEELIFRGWLYGKVRSKIIEKYSRVVTMVCSSLVVSLTFAIVHLQWNVGVDVFAMSIVLCGLREITGTVHAGIILHIAKNFLAFYLIYVVGLG